MGLITTRLIFLAMSSAPFDVESVVVLLGYLSVLLNIMCFDHLRSSASAEKRIFLAGALLGSKTSSAGATTYSHHYHRGTSGRGMTNEASTR